PASRELPQQSGPMAHRLRRLHAINLQEHFLDDILGVGNVPENAPGRAEHRGAMLAHNPVPVRHRFVSPASRLKTRFLQVSRLPGAYVTRSRPDCAEVTHFVSPLSHC